MTAEQLTALRLVAELGNDCPFPDAPSERRGARASAIARRGGWSRQGAVNRLLGLRRLGLATDVEVYSGSARWFTTSEGERSLDEVDR